MLKKAICFVLCFVFVFMSAACGKDTDSGENEINNTQKKETVISVQQDACLYRCSECEGTCTFFSGQFNCPAFNRTSESAVQLNAQIEAEYNTYLSDAKQAAESDSGLAYGFTYQSYADDSFAVIRTAAATVMLHSGGLYAYDMYYYDLKNDRAASAISVMQHFSLDPVVIAAYVRVQLNKEGKYSGEQISSVQPKDIDFFPLENTYYIKVKNEQIKYETELDGMDLNDASDEIAEVLPFIETIPQVTDVIETEPTSQEPTTQQRDIIMYEIVPGTAGSNTVG